MLVAELASFRRLIDEPSFLVSGIWVGISAFFFLFLAFHRFLPQVHPFDLFPVGFFSADFRLRGCSWGPERAGNFQPSFSPFLDVSFAAS